MWSGLWPGRNGYGLAECGDTPPATQPHALTLVDNEMRFVYDANGNMIQRTDDNGTTWDLAWTPENRLRQATGDNGRRVTLSYDADGLMVQRQEAGQTAVFLGQLYQHNRTLNTVTKHYLFNGQLVAVREGTAVSFLLSDHLGSVTTTVYAGTGQLQSYRLYTAWGEEYASYNNTPTGYQYTGQRWDAGLGLYDYQARYYDPALGKFISADSLIPDPASPQSFNRYAYVLGNPLRYSDPTGHAPQEALVVGGGSFANGALIPTGDAVHQVLTPGETSTVVNLAGFLPGIGDGIDVYDFFSALSHGDLKEAGTIVLLSIAPGSTRVLRNVSGEAIEVFYRIVRDIRPFQNFPSPRIPNGWHAHHLVEKRFWRQLGFESFEAARDNILSVMLPSEIHLNEITTELRRLIPLSHQGDVSLQEIWDAHKQVYAAYEWGEDWLNTIWDAYFVGQGITR